MLNNNVGGECDEKLLLSHPMYVDGMEPFCSVEARRAGNTDWNWSTFGTKLYCKALYQLDR